MKRFLFLILIMTLLVTLVACGESEEDASTISDNEDEQQEESINGDIDDDKIQPEDSNEIKEGNSVGDTISGEAGDSTLVSLNDDIGEFESGPIVMDIKKANGVHLDIADDETQEFFDGKDQLEYIQVDMEVENTSEDHITFYASQAVMTTSTGEQIEPDMLLSEHIDGEYLGNVSKTGTSFYLLENSQADEVESIKLFYSAPSDKNYEDIGEEIEVEIDLNK